MSIINLNMIKTIQGTLKTQQLQQGVTQEHQQQNINNNVILPVW